MLLQARGYRLLLSVVAAILLVAMVLERPVDAATSFTDVSARYTEAVDYLVDYEITQGYSETEFGTEHTINRIDAAILLAKALKLPLTSGEKSGFTDVPERGEPSIAALRGAGIVNGKTETTFAAYDSITRGEMALILARGFQLKASESIRLPFTDVTELYEKAVAALMEHHVTQGKTSTTFGTRDHLTRGEFALFLHRISKIEQDFSMNDLQNSIQSIDSFNQDYFTASSWSHLKDALKAAEQVIENGKAAQEDIHQATKSLLDSIKALELKPIHYSIKNGSEPFEAVFHFSKSIGQSVSGTEGNGSAVLSDKGTVLTLTSTTGAGDHVAFTLNLGGKKVKVDATWDGTLWEITTDPAHVFKNISDGQVIKGLEVLDEGLKDGSIPVEKLLTNPDLLRLTFLPDSGLLAGDIVKVEGDSDTILTHTLTGEDIDKGFVEFGIGIENVKMFASGETIDVVAAVERDASIIGSAKVSLQLPIFPLGKPQIDQAQNTAAQLPSILKGTAALKVDLMTEGLERLYPDSVLKLTIQQDSSTEIMTKTVTQRDINKGYLEVYFNDSELDFVIGSKVTFTPALSYESLASAGDSVTYELTGSLFGDLLKIDLLDRGLKDGTISLNKLLSDTGLLRATLLNKNLAAGSVVKVAYNNMNLLSHKLTSQDITRGYIDFGINRDILNTLKGGETLNLVGTVEKGGSILGSVAQAIKLPVFPLVDPVIDMGKNALGDLSYIFSGKVPLQIDITANGLERIEPGFELKLQVKSMSKIETDIIIITQEDIDKGYVEYYFSDSNIIQRLLSGITTGRTITITPGLSDGINTTEGETATYTVTKGLLSSLGNLLGSLLGGLLDFLL
ncbi:S-layer homology domain-containing protein [Bacillus tuaregi]|uniref:S-layer homology domain-containing protein n=1 Tax=Bacillus tuaregi TaxID=1816695 RepID=UPI0009FC3D3B|nr:S-layer homology domain-containing protein [Bacillus tuaregi]